MNEEIVQIDHFFELAIDDWVLVLLRSLFIFISLGVLREGENNLVIDELIFHTVVEVIELVFR